MAHAFVIFVGIIYIFCVAANVETNIAERWIDNESNSTYSLQKVQSCDVGSCYLNYEFEPPLEAGWTRYSSCLLPEECKVHATVNLRLNNGGIFSSWEVTYGCFLKMDFWKGGYNSVLYYSKDLPPTTNDNIQCTVAIRNTNLFNSQRYLGYYDFRPHLYRTNTD